MALIETPGLATADTYGTLAEALVYWGNHPYGAAMLVVPTATQENLLRMATKFLDASPRAWTGNAVDAIQSLGWPRVGMYTRNGFAIPTSGPTSIVQALKEAQFEFARQLQVADRTADNSIINKGITGISAGSVSLDFEAVKMDNSLLVGRTVRELNALAAMLPDAVKALLVPSWLKTDVEDPSVRRTIMFENL